jgi:hypothetical protein
MTLILYSKFLGGKMVYGGLISGGGGDIFNMYAKGVLVSV